MSFVTGRRARTAPRPAVRKPRIACASLTPDLKFRATAMPEKSARPHGDACGIGYIEEFATAGWLPTPISLDLEGTGNIVALDA